MRQLLQNYVRRLCDLKQNFIGVCLLIIKKSNVSIFLPMMHARKASTLTLTPKEYVTRSSKHGYQWPHKPTYSLQIKNKTRQTPAPVGHAQYRGRAGPSALYRVGWGWGWCQVEEGQGQCLVQWSSLPVSSQTPVKALLSASFGVR